MMNYNWNCKTVDAYVEQNEEADVVYNVHWRVTGTSDEVDSNGNPHSATSIGTQTLDTDDIVNFKPFDQVTNEDMVEWTKEAMGEEQVSQIEAGIASQIESSVRPKTITLTISDTTGEEDVAEETTD